MKTVKITGLKINRQLGILQAVDMNFDPENRLTIFKGETGAGKTTAQKAVQLGTQGSKTLTDKKLYGEIDLETQLLDGEQKIYVGCKSDKKGKLSYILYMKDSEGNKVGNPVIDGVKATPSKYLETLQTKLTWRVDELTSQNPTVQRNILFELYKYELQKVGVQEFLEQIEKAKKTRDDRDAYRKQVGGIAEDLKSRGVDVHLPDTLPSRKDVSEIHDKKQAIYEQKATDRANAHSARDMELQRIKTKASEVVNECLQYNAELKQEHAREVRAYDVKKKEFEKANNHRQQICESIVYLDSIKCIEGPDKVKALLDKSIKIGPEPACPTEPNLIKTSGNQVAQESVENLPEKAAKIVKRLFELRKQYKTTEHKTVEFDETPYNDKINTLEAQRAAAQTTNKLVDAVDAFHEWKDADEKVKELQKQYAKKLAEVNTGVEGLRIMPEESESGKLDIYLSYNGHYNSEYFRNPKKEYRKLSSYSGTQKPMIALLVQNYLLSKKPKSLRYMFIDDTPIDKKTRSLLEDMCEKLNIHIFVNVTGDFEEATLKKGELLIEGGEVFFN